MREINFDKLLFRASSMGDIMTGKLGITEKQELTLKGLIDKIESGKSLTELQQKTYAALIHKRDNPELSLTTKTKAIEIARTYITGRQRQIQSKYLSHGLEVEEDSITQYCMLKGVMLYKHNQRVSDTHFIGEIDSSDVPKGGDIRKSTYIVDAKSCWEVHTMPTFLDDLEKSYYWQMQTYMALIPSAEKAIVAKVLTNHSVDSILKRIDSLRYKHGIIDTPTEEFIKEVKELEKNSIYDRQLFDRQHPHYDWYTSKDEWYDLSLDIPLELRVHEFVVERDDKAIESMRDRVDECREWLRENYNQKIQL